MTKNNVCDIYYIHEPIVQEVKSKMLENSIFQKIAELFKIIGDQTRVKILYALSQKELCVCDLSALLEMTHSAVSHQLRVLRAYNMVNYRREGKIVYYSLADEHVIDLIKMVSLHVQENNLTRIGKSKRVERNE